MLKLATQKNLLKKFKASCDILTDVFELYKVIRVKQISGTSEYNGLSLGLFSLTLSGG